MKVFMDSSVIILGLEKEDSNSALIVDLISSKKIEAIINEKVLEEVKNYFRERRNRNYAFLIENMLRTNCLIVYETELIHEMTNWENKIKEKDLMHLATVKALEVKYLVAFDRDFEKFQEYVTPKKFVKMLKLKPRETEY